MERAASNIPQNVALIFAVGRQNTTETREKKSCKKETVKVMVG